jgi:hypothetical protein
MPVIASNIPVDVKLRCGLMVMFLYRENLMSYVRTKNYFPAYVCEADSGVKSKHTILISVVTPIYSVFVRTSAI